MDPAAVLARLHHRGPDDAGSFADADARLLLCAARLAIRDLSPRGHQPLRGPSGAVIAFNGELYNAGDLRRELERGGRRFCGDADTEVALAAFERWGAAAFARLRGMFALAIWDPADRAVWLARDPLGIKPLYVCRRPSSVAFASEVRALLTVDDAIPRLDVTGLASMLATGVVEEPGTMVDSVRMLPAGTAARFDGVRWDEHEYWSLDDAFGDPVAIARPEAVQLVRRTLEDAVRRQLVSDVPLGVFLSGGIDSSALVGLASAVTRPQTVSVVFAEEDYSEAPYIDAVRRRFDTVHHQVELRADDFLGRLPDVLAAMDQPTFDGVNTYVVSGIARAQGMTVALSGAGGDELFAGYGLFATVPMLERLRRFVPHVPGSAATLAARAAYGRSDRARKMRSWLVGEGTSAYALQREVLDEITRRRLLRHAADVVPLPPAADVNDISRLELAHYLRNVLLRDADVMSMAHSLEVRVPFLDQDVVELAGRLPGALKVERGREKPLLVDAVADLLPDEVRNRPKVGFTLPFERWLRGPLRDSVRDALLDQRFGGAVADALDPRATAEVWHRFEAGGTSWSRPWTLYVAKVWGDRMLGDRQALAAA